MNNELKENVRIVKEFLDSDDWHYKMDDRGEVVEFSGVIGGLKGMYGAYRFLLMVSEDIVQVYAVYPANANEKLAEMAEFITRANCGLKFGAFEMDYDDGAVRFHISTPAVAVREDTCNVLQLLLYRSVKILDLYSKGFTSVIMGVKSPSEAIADSEGKLR